MQAEREANEAAVRRAIPEEASGVQLDLHLEHNWRPDQRLLGPVCEEVLAAVQQAFPPVQAERVLADQLTAWGELVRCGRKADLGGRSTATKPLALLLMACYIRPPSDSEGSLVPAGGPQPRRGDDDCPPAHAALPRPCIEEHR